MLERRTVGKRPAMVSYLDANLYPVAQADAALVKVVFLDDDNGAIFLTAPKPPARKGFDPSEPRDEHGRWTDGGGGGSDSGDKKPVPGFSPGVKSFDTDGADVVKKEWFGASPFKGDIDAAIAAAPEAQRELGGIGEKIAADMPGVEFKNPGVKAKNAAGVARAKEKVGLRGGAERVTDLARAAFQIERPEQAAPIIAALARHMEVAAEGWNVTPVNYADRALQVRFKSGLIGEVQLIEKTMAEAKSPDGGGGHDLYTKQRALDPVKDRARYNELGRQQRALYGSVLDGYSAAWKAALGIAGK